jgi:long-chain acyl-CoA synthetase
MAIDTIPRQFLHSVETYDKKDAFRYKRHGSYVDVSHREMLEKVYMAALGLRALNLARQDRIAVISENRVEWVVADLAILSAGCINVPVYPSLPANQIEYILADAETRAVFVSTNEQLAKIQSCRSNLATLQHVICFDPDCESEGVITLDALIARGSMVPDKPSYAELISTISRSDWASIIYTSGTTGEPKGAVLTHWNFLSNVNSVRALLKVDETDSCLSFLPLSHVFERMAGYYFMMTAGATIAYAETMETVADNMLEAPPTILCGVPRFYEKIYGRVMAAVLLGSPLKQKLFRWGIKTGQQYVSEKLAGDVSFATRQKYAIADKLVCHKLQAKTGGRIRFLVSGGAPLSPEINRFFHAAGLPILEGYGLTETSPVIAFNTFEDLKFGTVGKPLPDVDVKIADDGEILTRGDHVMLAYYKKPAETAEAIVDGWFHTGDIGYLDEDGFLAITDRKKDVIVTAGGKNVAPQAIENRLKGSEYIEEAIVIGNKRKFVSAVIVPSFETLRLYALENNIQHDNDAELVDHAEIRRLFDDEIEKMCASFASYEQVKKYVLLDSPLTIETGELTPSLKVKRRIIEQKFNDQINALYEE